jgi:predicted acetyltransferase
MSAHVAGEPTISLVPVPHDDARIARLMQLYVHEWSAILPDKVQIGPDALFVYPNARDGLRAVLICDERAWPAGFALVARDEHDVAHVKELFVLAGLRRRGFGTAAARALFRSEPGPWTLTVRPENAGALEFWRCVMPDATETVEVGSDGVTRTRLTRAELG